MQLFQDYVHQSKYARYLEDDKRRETWGETVSRYTDYWLDKGLLTDADIDEVHDSILKKEVMPSMRAMMTSGKALDRDHVAGYNCAYMPIDNPRAFDEALYILCCGTGVGFSVEHKYVDLLPVVAEEFYDTDSIITVADSKIGWAKAYREMIAMLYSGQVPKWDVSKVRKKGERLKTFGGRASGPEPLESLFNFTINIFKNAKKRKLTSLECHDLMCKVGDIVVVGGVRRSAMISLSDLEDSGMRTAKFGFWWEENNQRHLANNSATYECKPSMSQFIDEWRALHNSRSGERGIFNREAAKRLSPERRDTNHEFGTNPCSEIILRKNQFCNLSEVIVREDDTLKSLKEKVKVASILGTLQSTLSDFRYLRKIWKTNTEEERLLGVSLTGICDHAVLGNHQNKVLPKWLEEMRDVAITTNKIWAEKLGIPESTAITCVKPSGTVSSLCDTASGIHTRFDNYYIRTVRQDNKDPLTSFMIDKGVPYEPCVRKPDSTTVFSFPMEAPKDCKTRNDCSAIDDLERWLIYQKHWCEHKPSVTINVREDEWMEVGAWVYANFDHMSGVSFLPYDGGTYKQAPYQTINKNKYKKLLKDFPKIINWKDLEEEEDNTTSSQELACTGGSCDV